MNKTDEKDKKEYVKPEIESEELMAFAAVCNGNPVGGRKASVADPDNCRSNRLNS
tara:strand:+ start:68317 stop:68481 length:165 start_codon:yes stop_codon:yes gene_type:complete